jgi:hypothetical protein
MAWHCGPSRKDYMKRIRTPRRPRIPRQYSLVRFRFDHCPPEFHSKYPFTRDGVYVFFGKIPNMPGHCVVCDHNTGQVYSGYHIENFSEIPNDET